MIVIDGAAYLDTFVTVPYVSSAGADAGRAYIFFITCLRECTNELIYKYDIDRDEFTQVEMIPFDAGYDTTGRAKNLSGACFDPSRLELICARENVVIEWGHFDKWYDSNEIVSTIEFSAISGQDRAKEKDFKSVWMQTGESIDINLYCSVNGLPPTIPITQDVTQDSYWDFPRKLNGYILHLKMTKTGGAGGKVFSSGVVVEYQELAAVNRGRSYLASKTDYIQSMWSLGAPINYGSAAAGSGTVVIAHSCPWRPVACFATLRRTGTVNTASQLYVTWNDTNITVIYTGYQAGDYIDWIAVKDNTSNPREGWSCSNISFWRSQTMFLDLSRNPGAVLLGRAAAAAAARVFDSNTVFNSDTRLNIPLKTTQVYSGVDYRPLAYGAFYTDNVTQNQLTCGSQSLTANTDTVIAHGLGTTPTVVCATAHVTSGDAFPFLRGTSAANITLRSDKTSRVDWVALK